MHGLRDSSKWQEVPPLDASTPCSVLVLVLVLARPPSMVLSHRQRDIPFGRWPDGGNSCRNPGVGTKWEHNRPKPAELGGIANSRKADRRKRFGAPPRSAETR